MLWALVLWSVGFRACAIESLFEGQATTTSGSVSLADQPAGLAWLDSKWSFSASGTSLNQTVFESADTDFQSQQSPLAFQPRYVATGKGVSWGGWAAQLSTSEQDFRASLDENASGSSLQSDLTTHQSVLRGSLAAGLRLSPQWALGWGLHFRQSQLESFSHATVATASGRGLSVSQRTARTRSVAASVATLMDLSGFRLGLVLSSSEIPLEKTSRGRLLSLDSSSGTLTEQSGAETLDTSRDWFVETGVRLGQEGSAFLIADRFASSGSHQLSGAYEYRAPWGLFTVSLSHLFDSDRNESAGILGFVHRSADFDWGVGPSYSLRRSRVSGSLNSQSYDLLYASEIRY